jgi:hypothetical protein
MRVGDAEREATAAELREHYASGRLTLEELNDRVDKAFAAKTRGDLDALMRDLPSARPSTAGIGGPRAAGSGWTGAGSGWTGPGSGWTGPGSGSTGPGTGRAGGPWAGSCGAGTGWGSRAGNTIGQIVGTSLLICALVLIGMLGVFGIGTGRPVGVVLLLAAFALLRRLIFGRRFRARGPRRRRY